MKKIFSLILSIILISSFSLYGCNSAQNTETDSSTQTQNTDLTKSVTSKSDDKFNPYSTENKYDIGEEMFEKCNDVDYGTVLKDVIYFSQTAGDNKQCNILLPAGYNENNQYPVMYIFHGFGGSHSDQIDDDSYVTLLYGNMLHDNLTVPQIIVNVDMYTDKQSEKSDKSDEEYEITDVTEELLDEMEDEGVAVTIMYDNDEVDHPDHYNRSGIETITIIEMLLTEEEYRGFLKGNILKHQARAPYKGNAEQDYAKAKWYFDELMRVGY